MALGIEQDVLWLQVSVDDVESVEVAQSRCNLSRIEPAEGKVGGERERGGREAKR